MREMLSGWSGTLVADGYAGYRALFRDGQEGASGGTGVSVRRVHGARAQKVHGAVQNERQSGAKEALKQIRALYIPEQTIRQRPAEQKWRWRRRYAKPQMEAFHSWLRATEKTSAPGGRLHGAVTYALKRWPALETYLNDGRVPLDNNRSE